MVSSDLFGFRSQRRIPIRCIVQVLGNWDRMVQSGDSVHVAVHAMCIELNRFSFGKLFQQMLTPNTFVAVRLNHIDRHDEVHPMHAVV